MELGIVFKVNNLPKLIFNALMQLVQSLTPLGLNGFEVDFPKPVAN